MISSKTSRYGSHSSMALDPLLAVICFGWRPDRVILRDERGTYATTRDRLDTGLADPRRWARPAVVATAS